MSTAKQGSVEEVLSDARLMQSSNLRAPLVFDIAARLRAHGYLPNRGALPHSREALIELIDQVALRLVNSDG